jgi:hypothetical protein
MGFRMKNRNRMLNAVLLFILAVILLLSPICASVRSYLVMLPYSRMHKRDSVLNKNRITFHIPGGSSTSKADWYPFVITFNDNRGLSSYLGESVEFTVLYSFGHFQLREGTSSYYNPESPYYSSFYGGYIVKPAEENRKFGFLEDGTVHTEELAKVPEYDQKHLVLSSLGCPRQQRVFQEEIISTHYNVDYAGCQSWVQMDSNIRTNSPVHAYRRFQQGYLQYGKPMGRLHYKEDFPVIDLKGRVYVRYFEELQATIVLYAMAPSWETIEQVDREILSKAEISAVP